MSDRTLSNPLCERCDYGPLHDDNCRGAYDSDEPCRNAEPEEYFAAVESRFESPSPYGRKEITVEAPKHVCECGMVFDTEQGLRVHKGVHSVMRDIRLGKIPSSSPPASPAKTSATREKEMALQVRAHYRAELLDTLVDLAICQVGMIADADTVAEVGPTLARIKAVVRDV